MFGLGVEKLLVLGVIALFVLGPERLPVAVTWLGQAVRRVKSFGEDAQQKLEDELGPEYEQMREPLAELSAPLQELRRIADPRAAAMRYLFSDTPTPAPILRKSNEAVSPSSPPLGTTQSVAFQSDGSSRLPPFDRDAT